MEVDGYARNNQNLKNRRRAGEIFNEITRGAPCKVEKLTKKANLTEMENLAKIANLTKIRHGFGKYSNWKVANMTKIGKSTSNGKNGGSG